MPSELGHVIRTARQQKGIGLREFAKMIGKSPGFVTQLECEDEAPSVLEDTLRSVADHLGLDADQLMVLAQRTPSDVVPESQLEVALYRKVKGLSVQEQQRVQKYIELLTRKREDG
jgi:transcriptional regulator with XRE-family HTH domain